MNSATVDIIKSNRKTVFRQYMFPSMMSMLAVAGYSFVDTYVVGRAIGAPAVAAMGLGTPVLCILYALGFLFGSGGSVRYSIFNELGEQEKAANCYTVSVFLSVAVGVLFCIAGNIFIEPLVYFLGASEANAGLTISYLRWILSLAVFMITDIVLGCYMRNEGHPNISMAATLCGTGLNIIIDFVFVLGFKWGMAGASSATCIASIVSVSINLSYAVIHNTKLRVNIKKLRFRETGTLIKMGLGPFVLEGATAAIPLCFNNVAASVYGDVGVAAFTVVVTINLVVYAILNGVAQGMQPLVSANFGAGKADRVKAFFRYSLIFAIAMGVVFTAWSELVPTWLCSLFVSEDAAALELSVYGLKLHAPSFLFMAISMTTGIYFQAKEKAMQSFAILLGRSMLFPVVLLFALRALIGGTGIWLSVVAGETIALVLSVILKIRENDK